MNAGIQILGWALLHALWQGCLLVLLAAFCGMFLTGQLRHRMNALALGLCLILPALTAWHFHQPVPAAAGPVEVTEQVERTPVRSLSHQPPSVPLLIRLESALQPLLPRLVALWALGASIMALRLGGGLALSLRWKRQGLPAPGPWQDAMDRVAKRMDLRRRVPLLLSSRGGTPVTLGLWKPVVLMPAVLLTSLPPDYLEALLAHELAHVRRLDYLGNLIQGIIEALLFFHPAVWWLSARIRTEREELADELAAQSLGDPRRLALALNALDDLQPDLRPPIFPALAARGGRLLTRIERLLSTKPMAGSPWGLVTLLLLPCAVLALHAGAPSTTPIPAPTALVAQIDALAAKEGLDPQLLRSMAWVESGFSAKAKSPLGAMGLLQVMPATAEAYGAKDLNDPAQVMAAGAKYLRFLLDRYQGDVEKAVTAYNCGEKALDGGQITEEATRYRTLVMGVLKAKAVQPEAPLAEGEVQGVIRGIGDELMVHLRISSRGDLKVELLSDGVPSGSVIVGNKEPAGKQGVGLWEEVRPNIRIKAPKAGAPLSIRAANPLTGWRGETQVLPDAPWKTFSFRMEEPKP